jgi:hypothetical protein
MFPEQERTVGNSDMGLAELFFDAEFLFKFVFGAMHRSVLPGLKSLLLKFRLFVNRQRGILEVSRRLGSTVSCHVDFL